MMAAPGQQLVIRRGDVDDLADVCRIEQASFSAPWSRSLLATELARPGAWYLSATVEGQLVGYVGLWIFADEGHICTLAVDPDWRGHGIGEALMVCALQQAAHLGVASVMLEYRVGNRQAERLYEKLGFEIVGRRPHYYQDTGEDAILATRYGLQGTGAAEALAGERERWEQERELELVIDL